MEHYDLDEFRKFVHNELEKEMIKFAGSATRPVDTYILYEKLRMILDLIDSFKKFKQDPELFRKSYETPRS